MVLTRSGVDVQHAATSYGRAARKESTRQQRKKRKTKAARTAPARTTRSISQMMQESEDDASSLGVQDPPCTTSTRVLRASSTLRRQRCSDFGRTQHYAFNGQGFMFCAPCDLWDSLPPDTSKRNSINSCRFGCKASHIYFSHPTTLKSEGCFEQRKRTVTQQQHAVPTITAVVVPGDDVACQMEEDEDRISRGSSEEDDSEGDNRSKSSSSTSGSSSDNISASAAACSGGGECHSVVATIGGTDESCAINHRSHAEQDDDQEQSLNSCATVLALQLLVETLKGKIALIQHKNHRILAEKRALLGRQAEMTAARGQHEASPTSAEANSSRGARRSRNKVFANDLLAVLYDAIYTQYRRWSDARVGHLVAKAMCSQEKFVPHLVTCLEQTMAGESIQFDYTKAMMCVTKAFHLDEIGKQRGLSVASSIDGASL
jgi:hypothetical protein